MIFGMHELTAGGRQTEHLNSLDHNMILWNKTELKYNWNTQTSFRLIHLASLITELLNLEGKIV